VFDVFFRNNPFEGSFVVFAGLEPLIDEILNLKFTDDDIKFLSSLKLFKDDFLDYLLKLRFSGNIYACYEGSIVFPNEPIIRVEANVIEAQLIEGLILNFINFQSLIATKSARIYIASNYGKILEFGLRRAQGINGAISAARASFIGGASATSNVIAGKILNIPVAGTMAHSWVMKFNSELEAFENYANLYPNNTILLVDTYDTLKSDIPNAIKVFKKLKEKGIKNFGIRLDSGDLEYLSKEARKMFDKAGLQETKIYASNELDEWIISQLVEKKHQLMHGA
jgi:nicotinate phosphoribosyltransferase